MEELVNNFLKVRKKGINDFQFIFFLNIKFLLDRKKEYKMQKLELFFFLKDQESSFDIRKIVGRIWQKLFGFLVFFKYLFFKMKYFFFKIVILKIFKIYILKLLYIIVLNIIFLNIMFMC